MFWNHFYANTCLWVIGFFFNSIVLFFFLISRKNLSLFSRWTSAILPKIFVSLDLLNPGLQRIPSCLNPPRSSPAAMYGGGAFLLQTTNSPDPLVSPTRRNLTMFPSRRSLTIRWTDRYLDRVLFQALARLDRVKIRWSSNWIQVPRFESGDHLIGILISWLSF